MKRIQRMKGFGAGSRKGFTLMEVLVSSALTLVILSMLFGILFGAMQTWQVGRGRLEGSSAARMALDLIARDLESMVVRQTTTDQEWLVSRRVEIPGLPGSFPGKHTHQLVFFAPSLDRDQGEEGDIVALSYKAGFQDPLTTMQDSPYEIFGLYKKMIDPETTFIDVLGLDDIMSDYWEERNPVDDRGLIIPHVVDFKVIWRVRSHENPDQVVTVPEGDEVRLSNVLRVDGQPVPGRLISADISLTLLEEEGVRMVRVWRQGGHSVGQGQWDDLLTRHGRVVTKRVKIAY